MPDYIVLTGQRLIDGTGNKPIENPAILIQAVRSPLLEGKENSQFRIQEI